MRLIDADALKERFHEELEIDCAENDDYGNGFQDGVLTVDSAPTIEAEPVVHAHWTDALCIDTEDPGESGNYEPVMKTMCSNCRKHNKQYKPPILPHCGAKMDEGRNE